MSGPEAPKPLNSLMPWQVTQEIGFTEWKVLGELCQRLYGLDTSLARATFRLAPSIITRSEAILVGNCAPRFAIRASLQVTPGKRSIFNLRRRTTFCCQPTAFLRDDDKKPRDESPADVIRNASVLADAVLATPPSFAKEFHVLEAALGLVYGDCHDPEKEDDVVGTPYTRHIKLTGGGLCAQAACFMCATLLHRFAKAIHGVAEFTTLAKKEESSAPFFETKVSGLMIEDIERCLKEVGLCCLLQGVTQELPGFTASTFSNYDGWLDENKDRAYRRALRAYLLSGMPIIQPCEVYGLAKGEKSLYRANGIELDLQEQNGEWRPQRHAVAIVGCSRNEAGDQFLIHDPSTMPFLTGTTQQLHDSAFRAVGTDPTPIPRLSCPVTPGPVRLHLMERIVLTESGDTDSIPGLFDIAARFRARIKRAKVGDRFARLPKIAGEGQFEHVFLVNLSDFSQLPNPFSRRLVPLQAHLRREFGNCRWFWVEFLGQEIWGWDAERCPESREPTWETDEGRAFLRFVLEAQNTKSRTYRAHWFREDGIFEEVLGQEGVAIVKPRAHTTKCSPARGPFTGLKPALITSFSGWGAGDALSRWPIEELPPAVDLYAFMQPELLRFLRSRGRHCVASVEGKRWALIHSAWRMYDTMVGCPKQGISRWIDTQLRDFWLGVHRWRTRTGYYSKSTLRMASNAACSPNSARMVARKYARLAGDKQIVAITTYFPEILVPDEDPQRRGDQAIASLRFSLSVAKQLRENYGHKQLAVVEIVGGALVEGLVRQKDVNGQTGYWIRVGRRNQVAPDVLYRRLLSRLLQVAVDAEKVGVSLARSWRQ